MLLDPWEKWIIMTETGPASKIVPWLIIALFLLLAIIKQPQENEEEPNQ